MTKFVGNSITFPKLSAAPSTPVSGDTYYDTTFNKPFTYNGTEWVDLTLTSATTGATGYWGSFWSTQDQNAASANTEYLITYSNTDPDSTGVSVVSNSRVTFAYSGVYSIIFSVQFANTSNAIYDATIWLKKNGSNVPDSNSKWSVVDSHGGVDGHVIGSVNYVLEVTAGDYLQLAWQTDGTAVYIEADPAASPAPAIPSVILTATQVMNTQQVELTNSTSTTSSTIAASATAVKSAYDLAASKLANISAGPGISVSGSGDSRQVSLEAFAGSSSSGTPGTSFVKSLLADVYGRVISYENGSVQNASTTAAGIVQLSDSISTTSSTLAATPTAVKSAYDIASGKASKSGDTFTGTIVITGGDSQTNTDTASLNAIGYNQRGGTGYHGFLDIKNTFGSATNPKKFFRINSTGAIEIINSAYTTNIFTLSDAGNLSVPSLSANDYVSIPSWNQAGAGLVGTASSVTVTTAGTYYAIGGSACEVSFTPDFVGQKFFVTMTGYASLNTTTIQYAFVRTTLTDSSNNSISDLNFSRSENFGTSGRGGTVATSLVWTSDTTSARKIKLYGTAQTTNGLVLTLAYWQINVMALA